jgi:folate-binding Fe-S cluster repair protein YgfZ
MPTALLGDRGVVRVTGDEARAFLDGLLTCAMDRVTPEAPRFGGLLTPQGKLLFDFIVFEAPADSGGGFYLDCTRVFAPDLVKRLGFYKLRAKVTVEDLSGSRRGEPAWGDAPKPDTRSGWWRSTRGFLRSAWRASWQPTTPVPSHHRCGRGHRLRAQSPRARRPPGRTRFSSGRDAVRTKPLMDHCTASISTRAAIVGQEDVSRMQHRGTLVTRSYPSCT